MKKKEALKTLAKLKKKSRKLDSKCAELCGRIDDLEECLTKPEAKPERVMPWISSEVVQQAQQRSAHMMALITGVQCGCSTCREARAKEAN